jgi:cytochrome-b5 reductase
VFLQSIRSYATEASPGSSRTPLVLAVGALVVGTTGAAGYTYYNGSAPAAAEAAVEKAKGQSKKPPKTFTGGDQGFIDLKLADVTDINHNVKRFRFELPQKDAVSGLTVACKQ